MTERYTFTRMRILRDMLVQQGKAVSIESLRAGDVFFVVGLIEDHGVCVLRSGVFYGRSTDKLAEYLIIHLDGEPKRGHYTPAQLGIFMPGSSMNVVMRSLSGIKANFDMRSAEAQETARRRLPCPCSAVRGDGSRCPEWPQCVIP